MRHSLTGTWWFQFVIQPQQPTEAESCIQQQQQRNWYQWCWEVYSEIKEWMEGTAGGYLITLCVFVIQLVTYYKMVRNFEILKYFWRWIRNKKEHVELSSNGGIMVTHTNFTLKDTWRKSEIVKFSSETYPAVFSHFFKGRITHKTTQTKCPNNH